jgi:hypothetical protein
MPGIETARIHTFRPEILEAPLVLRGPPRTPLPELTREGIRWRGGVGGRPLEMEIDFLNPGRTFSEPSSARIDIAPFGAFVPGQPLATAAVPSLPPGGVWTFRTAVASGDLPSWAERGTSPPAAPPRWERPFIDPGLPRTSAVWSWKSIPLRGKRTLRGILDLRNFIQPGAHFIGNLNVFVAADRPVERHSARAVELLAGRPNLGMFCIGDGQQAEYRFQQAVCEPGWSMELQPYAWDRPEPITRGGAVLIIVPPPKAESGKAAVRVDRVSTGESTLVEFELEVGASGSKCYFF